MTLELDVRVAAPEAPFRGIEAFRFLDQSIFFGRDEDALRLFELVSMYRGVLLYGDSGAGKSSLINARFVPMCLRHGLSPEIVRVRPRVGEELLVERIALSTEPGGGHVPSLFADPASELDREPLSLLEVAQKLEDAPSEHRTILIFDQFEEFITLFEESGNAAAFREAQQAQAGIRDLLLSLVGRSGQRVRVLFCFREDYLGKLMELFVQVPNLGNQYLRLAPLPVDELPQIVRGPFEANRGAFSRELSDDLANELQRQIAAQSPSGFLNLSEVQIVCKRLFDSADPEGELAERGVAGLLGDYLDERLSNYSTPEREAAVVLLSRLITASGTRNVVSEEDLLRAEPPVVVDELGLALGSLEADRLVRRERRRDVFFYEIVSEVLVPSISRERQAQLIRWQEAAERARQEEARRLQAIEDARTRRELEVARRQRLIARAGVALAVLTALISLLAVYALSQSQEARTQAAHAQAAASQAEQAQADLDAATALSDKQLAAQRDELEKARTAAAEAQAQADAQLSALGKAKVDLAAADDAARHDRELADAADEAAREAQAKLAGQQTVLQQQQEQLVAQQDQLNDARVKSEQAAADLQQERTQAAAAQAAARQAEAAATAARRAADAAKGEAQAAQSEAEQRRVEAEQAVVVAADAQAQLETAQTAAKDALAQYQQQADQLLADAQINAQTIANEGGGDRLIQYKPRAVLSGSPGSVTDAHIRPDGQLIVVVGTDGSARLWDPTTSQVTELKGHTGAVRVAQFSRGSHWVVTGGEDGTARVWDSTSGELRSVLQGHSGNVRAVQMSPNAQLVATGGDDGTARLWLPDGAALATLTVGKAPVTSLAFNEHSDRLVVGSDEGASVWDADGHRLFTLSVSEVTSVQFSPDDALIAAADRHGVTRLFGNADGSLRQTLNGHTAAVNQVLFSPDKRTLATASDDQTARIWDLTSGKSTILSGHSGPVRSIGFNSDGSLLITGSTDTTAWIWNTRNGLAVAEERGHGGGVLTAELDSQRNLAMTASADGTVRVWPTDSICSGPLQLGFGALWHANSVVGSSLGCPTAAEETGAVATQYFPNGMLMWWDPSAEIYVFYGQESGRWERHVLSRPTEQPVEYECPSGILPVRGFGQFLATHGDIAAKLGRCPTTIEEGPDQANGKWGARQLFPKGLMLFMPSTEATHEKRIWAMVDEAGSTQSGTFTRYKDTTPD